MFVCVCLKVKLLIHLKSVDVLQYFCINFSLGQTLKVDIQTQRAVCSIIQQGKTVLMYMYLSMNTSYGPDTLCWPSVKPVINPLKYLSLWLNGILFLWSLLNGFKSEANQSCTAGESKNWERLEINGCYRCRGHR